MNSFAMAANHFDQARPAQAVRQLTGRREMVELMTHCVEHVDATQVWAALIASWQSKTIGPPASDRREDQVACPRAAPRKRVHPRFAFSAATRATQRSPWAPAPWRRSNRLLAASYKPQSGIPIRPQGSEPTGQARHRKPPRALQPVGPQMPTRRVRATPHPIDADNSRQAGREEERIHSPGADRFGCIRPECRTIESSFVPQAPTSTQRRAHLAQNHTCRTRRNCLHPRGIADTACHAEFVLRRTTPVFLIGGTSTRTSSRSPDPKS